MQIVVTFAFTIVKGFRTAAEEELAQEEGLQQQGGTQTVSRTRSAS